ncbi:MAG TPA: TolC family protein [Steroidobacteraceae bacterium]|nr:TolC family protein [Steroidobacteraceae bacterium]
MSSSGCSRPPPSGRVYPARRLKRFRSLAAALSSAVLLDACALYHQLPLPEHPDLVAQVSQLRTQLPAAQGSAPRTIATDRPLDIDDIGLLAVLNDPDLRAEQGTMEVAQAGLLQSSLLPNPSGSVSHTPILGGTDIAPAWAASLTEDIKAILTYHTRKKAARFQVDQVNADLLWQEWQVAQQARILGFDLYWGGLSTDLAERQLQLLDREVQEVQAATQSGALDLTALAPLLAAKATAAQAVASLSLAQLQGWQQLDGLLGLQPDARFAIAPPKLAPLPLDLDTLIAKLPERRPDLVALQLGYRSADESVRSAIIGQFPALVAGYQWGQDTTNVRTGGPTASFDLPIFDRNQGQVAQARATRLQLHEQYEARLDTADGAAKGLVSQIKRLTGDVQQAERGAAAAEAQSKSAQQAYAQDTLDQRSLADFETTALQRRIEAMALERSLGEARIILTVDLGLGLPQTRIAPLEKPRKL